MAKIRSIRLFLSLATNLGWPLHQLNVNNTFLHGDLQEKVYMEQSLGFVAQGESGFVCRLRKTLYGLKQSSRTWLGNFSDAVQQFDMFKCQSGHSIFYSMTKKGRIFFIVYVDDIIIIGDDI